LRLSWGLSGSWVRIDVGSTRAGTNKLD
jgi:hypothetical protein